MQHTVRNILLLSLFILSACGGNDSEDSAGLMNPNIVDNSAKACYSASLQGRWNATDHGALPGGAHFTTPLFMVHNANYTLFKVGESFASLGLETLAETGGTSTLVNELASNNTVRETLAFSGLSLTGNPSTKNIQVSIDFPLISAASMVAPTPDWFIGVSGLSLINSNNEFLSQIEMDVGVYDAGSEDGMEFSLNNADSSPHVKVFRITRSNSPFLSTETTSIKPSLATLKMVKLNDGVCP